MTAVAPTDVRTVSAVFPCYNDEKTIGHLVDDVHGALCPLVDELEVIVVDDGSADGSAALLERMAEDRPCVSSRLAGAGDGIRTRDQRLGRP